MARRNIIKMGDPSLRKISRPITEFNERLATLLDDMAETMRFYQGMGLAAPQVGITRRVCIVETEDNLYELVNPTILSSSGEVIDNEGCLSVEGFRGIVARPENVSIDYFDRKGNKCHIDANGYTARAFLHEIDHLNGILFVDKMIRKATDKDYK